MVPASTFSTAPSLKPSLMAYFVLNEDVIGVDLCCWFRQWFILFHMCMLTLDGCCEVIASVCVYTYVCRTFDLMLL